MKRVHNRQKIFLAAYTHTFNITKAAEAAQIDRSIHYAWMKEDPEYPAKFAEAHEIGISLLKDAAVQRAVYGVDRLKVHQGHVVHVRSGRKVTEKRMVNGQEIEEEVDEYVPLIEKKYSDTVLIRLLEANCPEFRRTTVEHTGPGGGPIQGKFEVEFVRPAPLPEE